LFQLLAALGEGHVEDALAAPGTVEEKAQCEGGLSGPWLSLDEIQPAGRKAADEHVIEPFGSRPDQLLLCTAGRGLSHRTGSCTPETTASGPSRGLRRPVVTARRFRLPTVRKDLPACRVQRPPRAGRVSGESRHRRAASAGSGRASGGG